MTERKRRFVDAYLRLANGTRAAREAGYSERAAHVAGSRLIRDADVQRMLAAKCIDKRARAEQTYNELIAVSKVAVEELMRARATANEDPQRLGHAIKNARECLEVLAKIEGLYLVRVEHSGPRGEPLPNGGIEVVLNLTRAEARDAYNALLRTAAPTQTIDAVGTRLEHREGESGGNGNGHHG